MKIIRYLVILTLFFYTLHCSGQKKMMYDSLNSIRASLGKSMLHRSYILELKAKIWLIRMDHKYGKQVHSHGIGGEVLAQGCYDPLAAWMGSKPHKNILLSDRKRIGVAIYRDYACGKLR